MRGFAALLVVAAAALPAHAGGSGQAGGSRSRSGAAGSAHSGAASQSAAASKASSKIGRRSRIGRGASQLGTVASSRSSSASSGTASGGGQRRRIYGSDFVDSDQPLDTDPARGRPLGLGSQAVADDEPATPVAVGSGAHAPHARSSGRRPSGARSSGRRPSSRTASRASKSRSRFVSLVPRIEGRLPRLSTQSPGLLVVLSDVSSSMRHPFAGQRGIRKIDALADVVNGVLLDFVSRMNQGGTIKDRLDVLLAGYHSTPFSMFEGSLAGRDIVSIAELADNPADEIEEDDGEGNMVPRPVWINPQVGRRTQMRGAFLHLRGAMAGWRRRPAGPHLVLGIHVTDGESTDGSPAVELEALAAEVKQNGGELLMTNIHLSTTGSPDGGVIFPDDADALRLDAHGRMLFEMSSPVPAALAEQLGTRPGARMMAYNATVEQFARVFEAGSSIAAQ